MVYAAKTRANPNERTQCTEHMKSKRNRPVTPGYLIAVHQKGRLIKIFRPSEKNVSVGRSSRCDLRLPDPRFPRKAGEIVLGPVPILRRSLDNEEKGHLTSFPTGKPLRIGPYDLTLLEPGDAIFNRLMKGRSTKRIWLWRLCLITGAGTMVIFFIFHKTNLVNLSTFLQLSKPINEEESIKVERVLGANLGNVGLGEGIVPRKSLILNKVPGKKDLPSPPKKSLYTLPPEITRKAQKSKPLKLKLSRIQEEDLDKILKGAAGFIEKGSLKTAGRTLTPFLPYIDDEQRSLMIRKLDPALQKLFEKAYMLSLYEPEKSKGILIDIVESGLVDFPAYLKAQKMLDRN